MGSFVLFDLADGYMMETKSIWQLRLGFFAFGTRTRRFGKGYFLEFEAVVVEVAAM